MKPSPVFSIPLSTGWEDTGSEIVLVSMKNGGVSILTDVAARIWRALVAEKPLAQISSDLALEFPESAAAITADVEEFVNDLVREGFLSCGVAA